MPKYKTISASIQSEKDKLIYDFLMKNPMISNSKLIKEALNYYIKDKLYNQDIVNDKPKDNISVTSDNYDVKNDDDKETNKTKTKTQTDTHKEDEINYNDDTLSLDENDPLDDFNGDVNLDDNDNESKFNKDAFKDVTEKG